LLKRLLRAPWMQALLAGLVTAYVETIIATLRWRTVGAGPADAALRSPDGLIALFWHGRIAHAMACRPVLGDKARTVMISLSRDGAFIADAAVRLKIPTIRGSTGREGGGLEKGGAAAFRAAMGVIRDGGVMLLTPDGPRGPRETLQTGPLQLARAAKCPVYLMGLAASPSLALNSWDGGRLPLPFARAALVVEGPVWAPRAADPEAMETARREWQARMDAATARAEAAIRR
jgi:lysophospholipid acyltransferase (LPLAT)-like uncharacterized protein